MCINSMQQTCLLITLYIVSLLISFITILQKWICPLQFGGYIISVWIMFACNIFFSVQEVLGCCAYQALDLDTGDRRLLDVQIGSCLLTRPHMSCSCYTVCQCCLQLVEKKKERKKKLLLQVKGRAGRDLFLCFKSVVFFLHYLTKTIMFP